MRISDWSSDVCSSDLQERRQHRLHGAVAAGDGHHVDAVGGKAVENAGNVGDPFQHRVARIGSAVEQPAQVVNTAPVPAARSEEHTSELQSLMRISYAVFCLKHKTQPMQDPSIQILN